MKKYFAPIALFTWLLVSGQDALAQQRPGEVKSKTGTSQTPRQKSASKKTVKVKPASHESVVMDGEVIQGEVIHEGHVPSEGCESCGSTVPSSGCDTCGPVGQAGCGTCEIGGYGDLCYQNRGRIYISLPSHGWVQAEGLTWYQKGMNLPVLVRQTNATGPILFGGDDENFRGDTGGFRLRFGTWFGTIPRLGIEGEYVGLSERTSFFNDSTTPNKVIPINNINTGLVTTVSHPNSSAQLENQLYGGGVRFRRQVCCNSGCGFSDLQCQPVPVSTRLDLTAGYRYWQLSEGLTFSQGTGGRAPANAFFDTTDIFKTRNIFNGAELGAVWQGRRGWWSLDTLMRVGFGNVQQTVTISGSSILGPVAAPTTVPNSGLLALSSNRGIHVRDVFTMVPEFGATLGYQLTRRMRATVGYSAVYWGNVVRPGDQVDLDINTGLWPSVANPNPTAPGLQRPQFQFQQTDYWVHGLSYGLEFRW